MTTEILPIQVPGGFHQREAELNFDMANMYAMPNAWGGSALNNPVHTTTMDDMRFPVPTSGPFNGLPDLTTAYGMSNNSCLSPSDFQAADAMAYKQDTQTIAPQQMRFEPDESSPASYKSSTSDPRHSMSTNSTDDTGNSQQTDFGRGSISSQTSHEPQSPSTKQHSAGRRRKTEHVDPGSARATYLEKNRRAASKCRTKQKRQQEDLVEQAREFERRNKLLNAEVAMLQDDVRGLMEIVGQHTDCPDTRLRRYVQREADRLATGCPRARSRARPSGRMSIGHKS
jgi:hypothetical protein